MKKLLAIVLAMVMILSLAACASKPADNTKPSDTKSTDNTTKATEPKTTDAAKTDVTIELWTYPVGNWGNVYSGFLFCGDCGSPMFAMSRSDMRPAYTCGT